MLHFAMTTFNILLKRMVGLGQAFLLVLRNHSIKFGRSFYPLRIQNLHL